MEEKITYKFLTPGLLKGVPADKAAAELNRIREKYGVLKSDLIVEESKPKRAVLHRCFQWDDTIAAQMWRKEQARSILRNIVVVVTNETVTSHVRAFVNVARTDDAKRSYIPVVEAIHDDVAYKDLLEQSYSEMQSFVTKYSQITELNPVKAEMLKVING